MHDSYEIQILALSISAIYVSITILMRIIYAKLEKMVSEEFKEALENIKIDLIYYWFLSLPILFIVYFIVAIIMITTFGIKLFLNKINNKITKG